ncbi:hypothetical protein LBMAG56_21110 [Verrucomicrobiota bacterium]|nr:hypothetical protein LBMAG56_21110 [Verrucomicrobiota bacterium]
MRLLVAVASLVAAPLHAGPFAEQAAKLDLPANFTAIVQAGEPALPDLTAALTGPRAGLAVQALGKMRLKSAAPSLLPLVKSPDAELRAAAAWALGQCAGPDTAPTLAALIADTHPLVRAAAVHALAQWPQFDAAPAWRTALADADPAVRSAAVTALRASRRTQLFPLLLPLLDYHLEKPAEKPGAEKKTVIEDIVVWREPANSVRLAAIQTLGEFKIADALPPLIDALERETSFNRLAIIAAIEAQGAGAAKVCLGRIVPITYDADAIKNRLPLLINNGTLAVIAGRLGDDRCVPWLRETLKLPRTSLGKDKDLTELYIQSVELLGRFRDAAAAEPLAQILKESRIRQLSANTETALRAIGRPAARPLARHLDSWQTAPLFLRLLREPDLRTHAARDAIAKFLSHESDAVRLEATETLGLYLSQGILDEYDTPLLEGQFHDPNREVRASCARWQAALAKKSAGAARP